MSTEPHDDRWHYMDFRDGHHDRNFIEWKYFNFIQDGLAGYIIYYVMDPEYGTSIGGGRVLVRLFKDGKMYGALQRVDMDRVAIEALSAGITMDQSSVIEMTDFHYDIKGVVDTVSWKLSFTQTVPTIESFMNINPGILP